MDGSDSERDTESPTLYRLGDTEESDGPWYCKLSVEGVILNMQVDSGSSVSAISKNTYDKLYKGRPLIESDKMLTVYSGEKIKPVGTMPVNVINNDQLFTSKLYVIDNGNCPPILGRKWMRELQISLPIVAHVSCDESDSIMSEIMCKYKNVFEPGIGTFNRGTINLSVCADAVPVWRRARVVPHALRPAVDAELARLEAEGIISPIEDVGGWGSPIVPVKKQSGSIRICGDFKVTVNPVLCDDKYPLPRIEDLFSALRGGQTFSKIDLKSAYQQFLLDDDSKKLCTIVTHKGNFIYNRLPFGIKTASNKFQRIMDSLFKLPHVTVFVDDLIITGETGQEHKENLDKVFKILNECGLRISKEKCCFFKKQVSYLGHIIDAEGLHTETKKVDAVLAAERPSNVSELRAFLGLINYYSKFVKNFSTVIAPLYSLLKKNKTWVWSDECETGFLKIKHLLKESDVLVHFNPDLPLVLSCDASPRGVGAWLGHEMPDGQVRAVAHASRTLSAAEQNYSQICREGLAIIFGVQRFHEYVYGRHFILVSDCKPLCSIMGPKTGIPLMMAGRLQRWSIILSEYNYSIKCVKSKENCVADCLSRAATIKVDSQVNGTSYSSREDRLNESIINFIDAPKPIDFKEIAERTKKDITLNKIFGYVLHGWPTHSDMPVECKDYYNRKDYITSEHGCLLFGYRVIIPKSLQSLTLKELHSSHLGIIKMKSLARTYIYWPNIDKDIEQLCGSCEVCAKERDNPVKSTLVPWSWPTRPWYRLHLDHLGPFANSQYLVVIDAHSKWIEVCKVSSTNAEITIKQLRDIFARFGLPNEIVTDNGPAFISEKFSEFMLRNGICHRLISPRHARSNGAAENAVGLVKKCLKKAAHEGIAVDVALSRFLLNYRNCVQSTTQKSPSEMLLGRRLRSCLDLLRPCTKNIVMDNQSKQIKSFRGKQRDLSVGDVVMFKKWRNNKEIWEKGEVISRKGNVMYEIQYKDERHRRHIDQIFRLPSSHSYDPIFDEGDADVSEAEEMSSSGSGHSGDHASHDRETFTPASTSTPQQRSIPSTPYEEAVDLSDSTPPLSGSADQSLELDHRLDPEYDFVNTRRRQNINYTPDFD